MRTNQFIRCVFCCQIHITKNFLPSIALKDLLVYFENFQRFYGDYMGAVSKKYLTEKPTDVMHFNDPFWPDMWYLVRISNIIFNEFI